MRDQHASVTQSAILDAAAELFCLHGFANTSIRALADQAGVAVQTIYSAFGSKPGVLLALVERIDRGTVEPVVKKMMGTDDPKATLALAAKLERTAREHGADMLRVLRQAGASDPEVAPAWEAAWDNHRRGVASLCKRLADMGALRKGLSLEAATVAALAVTSFEVYDEVIDRRGWSHDRYEKWVADSLQRALLA